nr:MAG TPA: hypothetical protein [Caudoviricetes sp.]
MLNKFVEYVDTQAFKRGVYEMMVDRYLEDFMAAELFQERVEIGKMVVRILEKL